MNALARRVRGLTWSGVVRQTPCCPVKYTPRGVGLHLIYAVSLLVTPIITHAQVAEQATAEGQSGVIIGLEDDSDTRTYRQLRLDLHAAEGQSLPDAERSARLLGWIQSDSNGRSLRPREVEHIWRVLGELDKHDATETIRTVLIDGVSHQVNSDPIWLRSALSVGLLSELATDFDKSGRTILRDALIASLSEGNGIIASLGFGQFQQLQSTATLLDVPADVHARWINDWVLSGDTWQKSNPNRLTHVLRDMIRSGHNVDHRAAIARVIDHIVNEIESDPQWLYPIFENNYAYFGLTVVAAMRLDERYRDTDDLQRAVTGFLNASDVWPLDWSDDDGRLRVSNDLLRRVRYDTYHWCSCGGDISWGEGRLDIENSEWLADMIQAGLRDGSVRPSYPILCLMSWHYKGHDRLSDWSTFIDQQIQRCMPGSDTHVQWLLGRAYVAEIESATPKPTAGVDWIARAMQDVESDEKRTRLMRYVTLRNTTLSGPHKDEVASSVP